MVLLALVLLSAHSLSAKGKVVTEDVRYESGGVALYGMVAYDADIKGRRPVVVVVPEWWGLNDYARMRARMLAELGYIAIAADMYGEGKIADEPHGAMELAGPFYKDPALGKTRIEAAIARVKQFPQADGQKVAAIGYCFGGSMVLNAIKLGTDLKGVVSFHGGLATAPVKKGGIKGKILVCHGEADKFVSREDIDAFRQDLDKAGVQYTFNSYPDARHAFSNPAATETGKKFDMPIAYNEEADKRSWADMQQFLKGLFP